MGIRTFIRLVALAACFFLGSTLPARAQLEGRYEVAIKKQEEKKRSRWSLAEWLSQKENNRAMDLWLARNSHSSAFEFFLQARSHNYGLSAGTGTPSSNRNSYDGALAAYAGVAGLRGGYESDTENRSRWLGSLNLRLFGRALQDTHINLEYGLTGLSQKQSSGETESFQNQYGGASLNIYFTKYFGIEGSYRKILPAQSERGRTLEGEIETGGVFIDFGILRVFGDWRKDFLKFDGAGLPDTSEFREGFGGGLRLYF